MAKYIHESVAQVISGIGIKPKGREVGHANNRSSLFENQIVDKARGTDSVTLFMSGHPQLSEAEIVRENMVEAKKMAFKLCAKAGGFPILGEAKDGVVVCTFTKDKAKATIKEEAELAKLVTEAKTEAEDDETDGTGEPSGDTKTNTGVKNKEGVGTKKGTKVDNKGEENSKEVSESEEEDKKNLFKKEKLDAFKAKKAKRDGLAAKKDKSKEEVAEMEALDLELDSICESFYDSLEHGVTFVLYEGGAAEVHGLTEEEIAPFGGSAPMIPAKYAKKAKDAGPNSKVDNGVLTLHKPESWKEQGAQILTGKDFKANGWSTPHKGYGKQSRWSDTGKMPLDSKKTLKAGTEK